MAINMIWSVISHSCGTKQCHVVEEKHFLVMNGGDKENLPPEGRAVTGQDNICLSPKTQYFPLMKKKKSCGKLPQSFCIMELTLSIYQFLVYYTLQ